MQFSTKLSFGVTRVYTNIPINIASTPTIILKDALLKKYFNFFKHPESAIKSVRY